MIEVEIAASDWPKELESWSHTAASAVFTHQSIDPAHFEVALLATDDTQMRNLNRDFREKDRATNVLSWPSTDLAPQTPGARPSAPMHDAQMPWATSLGDIALGLETVRDEAATGRISLEAHVKHLITHGILHLLGYDHQTDADAEVMETIERDILATMGIDDPYAPNS